MLYDHKLADGRFDAEAESKLPAQPWRVLTHLGHRSYILTQIETFGRKDMDDGGKTAGCVPFVNPVEIEYVHKVIRHLGNHKGVCTDGTAAINSIIVAKNSPD